MRHVRAPAPGSTPALTVEDVAAAPTLEEALARVEQRYDLTLHPYFQWMAQATRDEFRQTQIPFRFAVEEFAHALAAVLAHITDPTLSRAIAENIAEEHGHGNELATHKATFLQYLRALGAQPSELERACPAAVHAFNQALLSFCMQNGAAAGAAATGVIEHLYIWISGVIARTLADRRWCEPGSQRHYEVHELLDQTHARDLLNVARAGWDDQRKGVALGLVLGAHWFWALYLDLLECR
jgi:pyrroloquinoline-quinone synthase